MMRRMWRHGWVKAAAGMACVLALLIALDRALPPDMTRYEDRSTLVLDRDGDLLRAFLTEDDIWRLPAGVADVDPRYLAGLIAYEDRRFYRHFGIDPAAMLRATAQWAVSGRIVSGASTLTMQAARLLEPGATRTPLAKLRQMARAVQLELRYSKDEILSIYLTLAPFGGNIEGVRAASLAYFGKEPARLTPGEAALLIALPQSPEALRPDRHPARAVAGRRKVLERLAGRGLVTAEQVADHAADPAPGRRAFPFHAPHLAERLKRAHPPGAVVRTTIDGRLQRALERLAADEARFLGEQENLALVVIANETRDIIAYAGSADYHGAGGQMDLARAARSPGSALKPLIYAMAFDELPLHPETLIDDRAMVFGGYAPRNFDRDFQGTIPLRLALQHSLNLPAVALLDRIGPVRFAAGMRAAGAQLVFSGPGVRASLPLALGGVGITLHDITMLYAALPGGGMARPARVLAEDDTAAPRRLFGETAAWYVMDMLRGSPMPDGWSQGRGLVRTRNIGFKTGTSYGYRDAWTIGASDRYTVGIWVGRPDGTPAVDRVGRNAAAPVLWRVFDALPPEPALARAPPPPGVIAARSHADLPAPMRAFDLAPRSHSLARRQAPPPSIAFPPDGARLAPTPDGEGLPLRAAGGTPPLRWMADGEVLPETGRLEATLWRPNGEGFSRITVIDADGRAASATVRVLAE